MGAPILAASTADATRPARGPGRGPLSRPPPIRLIAAMGGTPTAPRAKAPRRRRAWIALLVAVLLYGYAGHVEPAWLEVTHHDVALRVAKPITLAHLTDLHTVGFWRRERRLVEQLEVERPDVIVITGDTLCQGGNYDQCKPLLEKLHAPLGVYMVPGNWEVANPIKDLKGFFAGCGVRYLRNESVELVPGLWLVGLDDFAIGRPDFPRAVAKVPAGTTRIVLCHSPGFFDRIDGDYDLAFAGHTHGGQVRLPFLPPLFLPAGCGRFVAGWYERDGRRLYVSRGIGMSGLRFRFCCRPELAIHRLVPTAP